MSAAAASNTQPLWIVILVASLPAAAAIVAAVVAGRFARSSKSSENEAQRLRDLESRISERKFEVYQPMIALLSDLLYKEKSADLLANGDIPKKTHDFATWASIYASDETVRAFRNLMQAAYSDAPKEVFLRLYSELVLAARRDIGRPDTSTTPEELLALRIHDLYDPDGLSWVVSEPFEEVCRRTNWSPPWAPAG